MHAISFTPLQQDILKYLLINGACNLSALRKGLKKNDKSRRYPMHLLDTQCKHLASTGCISITDTQMMTITDDGKETFIAYMRMQGCYAKTAR